MLKLKKLHSKNRFFFIVFYSLFLFFFSISAIFFLVVVLQKIRKKKVLCKNVIARQRDQTHVHSKEVFSSHKISSKKHANQIIISESFSESYFDLLFNENFVTAASNTIIKKDNSKNQKITKSKQIAEKKKEEKSLLDQNKKNKKIEVKDNQKEIEVPSSQKKEVKKVSREKSWKKEEQILSLKQSSHEVNGDFLRERSSSVVTSEMQEKNLENQDFLKGEIVREEKELSAYADRIVKHIKQFPGKKTKLEIILKTGKGRVSEIFFSPEPRSIAYRNYLMQLLESTEVPGALREQEVHIFL